MQTFPRYCVPSSVVARVIGDETVILDLDSGSYYGLDEVGTRIWTLIGGGLPATEICAALVNEFDTDSKTAGADVDRLTEELLSKHLLAPA